MSAASIGLSLSLAVFLALGAAALILARPPKKRSAGDLRLHRIDDGIYLYRGYFSNSAVFVMKSCVVVVDSQVAPIAARRLLREIAKVTDLPIKYVINTHYHGDHTGGNGELFREGVEIIASEDTARLVRERDAERVEYANTFGLRFREVHPTMAPTRTFSGKLSLEIDGDGLEIMQLGRVETPDASIVWWPSRRVVACGDGIATHDYPYLGVPFLDEGLRDDGSWLGYLEQVRALAPVHLLAGHGPSISGEEAIRARIDLLSSLMRDLIGSVKDELARGTPVQEIVERVDRRLAHYRKRPDLKEHTVSQRFAIYRCLNNMIPERKGRGWWHDLRPSVIRRAAPEDARREIERMSAEHGALTGDRARSPAVCGRASGLAKIGDSPLAIALLEAHLEKSPDDAHALAVLSDVFFECARDVNPKVDATEYIGASIRAAERAHSLDPHEPLALLNLGAGEVFGGMVLAQPMDRGVSMLEAALASETLDTRQRQRALFFLGRAHQLEERPDASDASFKALLPVWARFVYPLLRERIRAHP
jgi:cyclase